MAVQMRVDLMTLCGGEKQAREQFIDAISSMQKRESYTLLMAAWNHGFISANNLLVHGVRAGRLAILVKDQYGEVIGEFIPRGTG